MPQLKTGELVWGKMRGYSAWPSKIVNPPNSMKLKKGHYFVFFFGSENYGWIQEKNIFAYAENIERFSNKNKSASFQKALAAIGNYKEETVSKSVNEMQPVLEYSLQKGKGKKEKERLNVQHRFLQSEDSRPSEAPVETAKERREKIYKRIQESKLDVFRKRNFDSIADSGQMHQASIRKKRSNSNLSEKENSGRGRLLNQRKCASASKDEILFDELVPLTHIKVEIDTELDSPGSVDSSDSDHRPLILEDKPEVLGYLPSNISFKSKIVASHKREQIYDQSQQNALNSDKSETRVRRRKQNFVSSFLGVRNEETAKPSTSGFSCIKSLINSNDDSSLSVANMPTVVISQEDQKRCAQHAASCNPQKKKRGRKFP